MQFVYTVCLTVLLAYVFVGCEEAEEKQDPGHTPTAEELVGNWYINELEFATQVTTNSDEIYLTTVSDGDGIYITGDYEGEINEWTLYEEEGAYVINVAEAIATSSEIHQLTIIVDANGDTTGNYTYENFSTYITAYYTCEAPLVVFDASNKTFTLSASVFTRVGADGSVTISGQMNSEEVEIPANTPTVLETFGFFQTENSVNAIITFEADSTFGGGLLGTWELRNDSLLFQLEEIGSFAGIATLAENVLTFIDESDICELANEEIPDYNYADCMTDNEENLGLSAGSLVSNTQITTWVLSK